MSDTNAARPPYEAPPPGSEAEPTAADTSTSPAGFDHRGRVRRTRISGVWVGLIAAAVFLTLLVIFIAQNQTKASIHFLGWDGKLSVGLTILAAAICGLLIAVVPGSVRIFQLRRALKKNTPVDQRSTH
jgi:uncharacterized integral membrane protein